LIFRNGFEPERIEAILHKIELGLKHQTEKFGLNLGVVSINTVYTITKTSNLTSANFSEGNILLEERTQMINNEIKLHILGAPVNELGNWLITYSMPQRNYYKLPLMCAKNCQIWLRHLKD